MCKKTLISYSLKEKEKEVWGVNKLLENNYKEIVRLRWVRREKDVG